MVFVRYFKRIKILNYKIKIKMKICLFDGIPLFKLIQNFLEQNKI